ncbi:helix-turn-helix domain-containing protein [Kitasatospora sp. NPDC093679]|uniref:helix-turn-helix domain-containing protein n=1 Tax=Kitasatospora sp. NPDC093679 TaxID=3154983 RepID=UPI00343387C4
MSEPTVREQALGLLRAGVPNAEVARRLGVPPGTVAWWKHRENARRGELPGRKRSTCPHCHGDPLDTAAYCHLLGLYLGDGHILHPPRQRAPHLTITCDDRWPGVMDSVERAMRRVLPNNSPCRVRREGCHDVKVYSTHLVCHFPQHGPGRKHERRIVLEPWQQAAVDAHPWELLRGLLHSDGCRITNWATRTVGGTVRRHEYPRWFFTNTSADIRRIFTDTLDAVGVEWRASVPRPRGQVNVSVARRASVALVDAHVGPKW